MGLGTDPQIAQISQMQDARPALCETCLERGRTRTADIVTEDLQMCRDCFEGKPTCREETIGGSTEAERRAKAKHHRKRRMGSGRYRRNWARTDEDVARAMLGRKQL